MTATCGPARTPATGPNIQQIEVLKGPASVLYGAQPNTGGMVNLLSKKPLSTPLAEMELSAGRWGYQRGTLDLGGPLNENRSVTYRLNMAGESSESFRDYLFERKLFIASALRWDIGPEDSLLVSGDLMNRRFRFDPGLPAPSASAWLGRENGYPGLARDQLGYALPINTYIGYGNWDSDRERTGRLAIEWEHDINESWHLKASFLRDKSHFVSPRSRFLWFQPTDDGGQPAGPLASLLEATIFADRFESSQLNLDLAGEFEARGIKHKLLAGISNVEGSIRTDPQETRFLVAQDLLSGDAWRDPGTRYTLVPSPFVTGFDAFNSQKHKGLYAQDMMEFSDRWKALIGYRYHIALGNSSVRMNEDVRPDEFTATGGTPRLGLVWQPSKTVTLYAGWSKAFNPNWGKLSGGGQAPPELGTQYEIGLKKDFADGKLNLNLAAYRIDKTNVERCAPDSPDCLFYVLVGGQRSQGVELDLNGEPLPNLRLSMAMTLQDARIVQDLPPEQGGLPAGDRLTGVPRWMFNVFGSYKVKAGTVAGLVIGGGWNRTADTEGNLPNDKYRIAGNTRLDLLAEYPFTASTKLQLNINNVTNQISYASPSSGVLVFANKPREAVLTLITRR
jgi:iron complex outermembrane receptor protein